MYKRTVFAMTFSLVCWAGLQLAVQMLSPLATSEATLVSAPIGLAPQVFAQTDQPSTRLTTTFTATQTEPLTGTLTESLSAKLAQNLTDTTPISITSDITVSEVVTPPNTAEAPVEEPVVVEEAEPELPAGQADLTEENPVLGIAEGTILANRSVVTAKFFVEGQIHELISLRSVGLELPRASTVLNLYNCDAAVPESEEGCYWDPYMVDRDGFYEIIPGADNGEPAQLMLQEVGGPTGAAIWIQNQSAQAEMVVYRNKTFDLLPGALREFAVGDDALPTFFIRSCVEVNGDSACEWIPVVADTGSRYALIEVETSGGLPNSQVSMLDLLPLNEDGDVIVEVVEPAPESQDGDEADVASAATAEDSAPATQQGPQFVCTLLVPALNVRSGPGLEYEIIAKVRSTETEVATVMIVGRDVTQEWLAVDEVVAPGGWIISSANFVACDGAVPSLDVTEITDGRLAPTPAPEAVAEVTDGTAEAGAEAGAGAEGGIEGDGTVIEEVAAVVEVPKGQSLLLINNGFDQELRFTLDQEYRVTEGPSEYDLKPGESTAIFVYPGLVGFSASTAWRGLSDNNDFFIEEEDSRELWLFFMPDPDGSGRWILQY